MKKIVMPTRRSFLAGSAAALAGAALPVSGARAAWQPSRGVEFMVSVGPGGGTDVSARVMQGIFRKHNVIDQPITVVNMPGGGGAIGLEYLANADPDGHIVAIGNPTLLSSHIVGQTPHTYSDVTPLAITHQHYVVFAVRTDSPLENAEQFLDMLRADPQSLSISVGGALGNQNHVALASVAKLAGVDPTQLRAVVFSSGADSLTATLGGHVDMGLTGIDTFAPHIEAGTIRLLAITAPERIEGTGSDTPTWREMGYDVIAGNWYGVWGPKGMGADPIAYWDEKLSWLAGNEDWDAEVRGWQAAHRYMNSSETAEFLANQYEQLRALMTELGLAA